MSRTWTFKVTLSICVGLYLLHFSIVWMNAVNIPYWDEWEFFAGDQLPADLSLRWLFSQHNEHRIVTTKLFVWLQYQLNGWNLATHQLLNFIVYGLLLTWIVWFIKRVHKGLPTWVILAFMIFLLSPVNCENHFMGFQSNVHFWLLFLFISSYFLFGEFQKWSDLVAGCTASILGIYSNSAGFVTSLIILMVFCTFKCVRAYSAAGNQNRTRELLQLMLVVGLIAGALAVWTINYQKPAHHPPLSLPHTWKYWNYFLRIVGFAFGIEDAFEFYKIQDALGAICLLIVLVPICGQVIRHRSNLPSGQWAAFAAAISILGILAFITAGRAEFGSEQAISSRYAEFGMALIPLSALSWSLFLLNKEKLKNYFIAGLWLFCFIAFFDGWWWFRYYKIEAARRTAGIECIKTYYAQGGVAYCPTIYPNSFSTQLEHAAKLRASFTRGMSSQIDEESSLRETKRATVLSADYANVVVVSRDASGQIVATITVLNPTTQPIPDMALILASAGALDDTGDDVEGTPVPQYFGTLAPSQSASATITFPDTVGVPTGLSGLLRVYLKYAGRTYVVTKQVTAP